MTSQGAYPVPTSVESERPKLTPSPYSPSQAPAWHTHVPRPAGAGGPAVAAVVSNADRARAVSTYRFADDLFFVALDDRTGQLRVHADVVGFALAGALLAELAVGGWVDAEGGLLLLTADARRQQTVPRDALTHKVLDTILGQNKTLSFERWISFLAGTAEQEVAERLGRANQILVEQRRRGLGKSMVYKPADNNDAAWPRARLSEHCRTHRQLAEDDVVLAGLCHTSGLLHNVLDAAPAGTYEYALQQVHAGLRDRPCELAVLGALEYAVTAGVAQLA